MTTEKLPILYSFFKSSASWRVRTALEWKGIKYEYRPINLFTSENKSSDYEKINPLHKVPAFITSHGHLITQSTAILEYLEETYPDRPLLPKDPIQRAYVREISQIIACDIHPIQSIATLDRVAGNDVQKRVQWAKETIEIGFKGLESRLAIVAGKYSIGDDVTLADIYLNAMTANAISNGVDMNQFPIITRINNELMILPEFISASPENQPDFK